MVPLLPRTGERGTGAHVRMVDRHGDAVYVNTFGLSSGASEWLCANRMSGLTRREVAVDRVRTTGFLLWVWWQSGHGASRAVGAGCL